MSSSPELTGDRAATWAPALDLTPDGLRRFDTSRVPNAVRIGREAGYRAGQAEATADARRVIEAEFVRARAEAEQMLAALQRAASVLDQAESTAAATFAEVVFDTVTVFAEAVLQRELTDDSRRALDAMRRALSQLDRTEGVIISLHPDDLGLLSGLEVPEGVVLRGDPALRPGDAIASTDEHTVDARISTAIDRARRALLGYE